MLYYLPLLKEKLLVKMSLNCCKFNLPLNAWNVFKFLIFKNTFKALSMLPETFNKH